MASKLTSSVAFVVTGANFPLLSFAGFASSATNVECHFCTSKQKQGTPKMCTSVVGTAGKFRESFKIAKEAIQWYPGHMAKSFQLMQNKIRNTDCVFEVHDARIPISGRNPDFVKKLLGDKPHILVLNKKDLIPQDSLKFIQSKLEKEENIRHILFTNSKDQRCRGLKKIMPLTVDLIKNSDRFNRATRANLNVMVIGVPNVGKSSLINALRGKNLGKGNAVATGAIAGITTAVQNEVKIYANPPVFILDTPGILPPNIGDLETGMKLALCSCLNDCNVGEYNIADFMLYWFNKNNCFNYVDVLGLDGPSDDILPILMKIATEDNRFIKKLNITTHSYDTVPDVNHAAKKILKMFRECAFGHVILDSIII